MRLATLLRRAVIPALLLGAGQPAAVAGCVDDAPAVAGSAASDASTAAAIATPPPQEINFDAEHSFLEANGYGEFLGPVHVQMGDRQFVAQDKVTYDEATNNLQLFGKVDFRDTLVHLKGDSGTYGDEGGQFHDAQFEFLQQPGHGRASEVDTDVDGKILQLTEATYTTCPADQTDWLMKAHHVTLDTNTMRGEAHGARVRFKGVTVLYLPWLSFPLNSERQSGLLFPTIGSSSRGGLSLTVPWYWNIAPNADATFSPQYFSERGFNLGTELRYLGDRSSTTLQGAYLPDDEVTGAQRSYVKIAERVALPRGWRVDVNGEQVSDTAYLEDFGDGTQISSTPFLPQRARLGYRDDTWQFDLLALHLQTLDASLADLDRPYVELPRLDASGIWSSPYRLLQWGFDSEAVNFWRDASLEGWRAHARPQAQLNISDGGYYLRPSVAWDATFYQLHDNTPGSDTGSYSQSRNLPIVSLDTGLQFERLVGARSQRSITLEPRLLYMYIPYRDQSNLPVFDSAASDINLTELFATNRYVGLDRISDANEVTLGLTTRMFAADSGTRYLSASFGERFNFEAPRVTLPGEVVTERSRSDLVGQIDLTGFYNWNVQTSVAWNPDTSRAEKTQVNLQYVPATNKVVNFGYRYQQGQLEQTDASIAWPVGKHWDLYGRSVYSLRDDAAVEHFAGFQFRGGCWGLRFVARRSVSRRTGEMDSGFYLQLELNGLSSVGTGADTFLERSIRGYSASSSSL